MDDRGLNKKNNIGFCHDISEEKDFMTNEHDGSFVQNFEICSRK